MEHSKKHFKVALADCSHNIARNIRISNNIIFSTKLHGLTLTNQNEIITKRNDKVFSKYILKLYLRFANFSYAHMFTFLHDHCLDFDRLYTALKYRLINVQRYLKHPQ